MRFQKPRKVEYSKSGSSLSAILHKRVPVLRSFTNERPTMEMVEVPSSLSVILEYVSY